MVKQQSKPNKMYSVEVYNGRALKISQPCVYAQTPQQAVLLAINNEGWGRNRNNIAPWDGVKPSRLYIAKVCLLGGKKESVNYYEIA